MPSGGLLATPQYRQGAYEDNKMYAQKFGAFKLPLATDVEAARGGLPVHGLYREIDPGYSLFGSVHLLKTDALFFDPKR